MDFTLNTYRRLLDALVAQGYAFQPFAEFLENPAPRAIILRHDVEARYANALAFAKIQHRLGIRGTYFFRFLPRHFDSEIIREIAALGHEIGYHYDDLSHCNGDYNKAIRRFEQNLATLREIAPVKTICMEGAPLSKWDNRDLWRRGEEERRRKGEEEPETRNYHSFGIIGEPYFDLDFNKVLYLTDTGRRWDGAGVSVRDKVVSQEPHPLHPPAPCSPSPNWRGGQGERCRHTRDIIAAANNGLLPDRLMLTFHPQRWTDKPLPWLQELVLQNVKNVVKRWLVKRRA